MAWAKMILGQSSHVFFFVGSYIYIYIIYFKDRGRIFFRWGGGVMDGEYHGRSFSGFQRCPA